MLQRCGHAGFDVCCPAVRCCRCPCVKAACSTCSVDAVTVAPNRPCARHRSCWRCRLSRPRRSPPSTSSCGASRTPTPWASTWRRRRSWPTRPSTTCRWSSCGLPWCRLWLQSPTPATQVRLWAPCLHESALMHALAAAQHSCSSRHCSCHPQRTLTFHRQFCRPGGRRCCLPCGPVQRPAPSSGVQRRQCVGRHPW